MTPERWARIKEIFSAALEKPEAERADFLDEACGTDTELRQQVQRLLREQDRSELESPVAEMLKQAAAPSRAAGSMLSHYRLEEKLGEGGMGVVYTARDTKLGRWVAIKVLHKEFSQDWERMARFKREARLLASLNHTNIAAIHSLEESDGAAFLVLEHVPGKTLAQRLARKRLPVREAIALAVQVAEALEAAHEKGVIHRDLKPANIKVTDEGKVKVLDFGIAKAFETEPASDLSRTVTEETGPTEKGVIVGTAAYMSPEQACGKPLDTRTDIWSFGCVLYEMVTGRRAFESDSELGTLAAILKEEPKAASQLVEGLPGEVERIIKHCLRKNPAQRFQHMSDLKVELEELKQEWDTGALAAVPVPKPGRRWIWALAVSAILLVGAGGTWVLLSHRRAEAPVPEVKIVPVTSYPGDETFPGFSPDGSQIAFAWRRQDSDNHDIYVKVVGSGEPLQLTRGPEKDVAPAWSPDARQIAFCRRSEDGTGIYTVSPLGGSERLLAQLGGGPPDPNMGYAPAQLSWSPDGELLAFPDQNSPGEPYIIWLLSVTTGEKHRLTSPPAGWLGDGSPAFSPDGQALAFVRVQAVGHADIYLAPAGGGEPRRLTFDDRHLHGLAWTVDGHDIVFSSYRTGEAYLWRASTSGGTPQLLAGIGEGRLPSIPRQGRGLVFAREAWDTNIWRVEAPETKGAPKPATRLIASTRSDENPVFSPDGKRIAFMSNRSGSFCGWVCDSNGSNPVQLPIGGRPAWSPDGRDIAVECTRNGNLDIYVIRSQAATPRRLTTDSAMDTKPSWSRDGQWVYFASNRAGTWQVWKVPTDGGAPVQVTKRGGYVAFESPDGKFVYYTKDRVVEDAWRVPVGGGEEVPVLENLPSRWRITEKGLYFIDRAKDATDGGKWFIQFFDFATKHVTPVADLPGKPLLPIAPAVSPDGRTFLYTQVDASETDLMLVENFR